MAFDFPSAPAVGDKYESLGVTYSWNGTAWDLGTAESADDKVSKAGDTMTGDLLMVAPAKVVAQGATPATMGSARLSGGGATQMGLVEWFKPDGLRGGFMGWGDATRMNLTFENGIAGVDLNGQLSFGSRVGASVDDFSKHFELYGGGNGMGIGTSTGGQFNFVLKHNDHAFNFRVGANTRAQINKDGLGPRASHNVTFQNGMTGTMDFRVNPAMVTMRILNVKSANAQVGTTQHVKICDYPAGVPAPWGNLYVHVEGCSDTAFTFLGRHAMVSAQTTGVFLSMYGGSTNEDFPANTYFSCTLTWSR